MPTHKKCWIFVKGTEYNPNRSLSLGQILSDPLQPSFPLLPDGPPSIEEHMIERSYQEGVTHDSFSSLDTSFGIWAKADFLPLEGDISGHRQGTSALSWHFDKLEGQIFTPRVDYVAEALAAQTVKDQIKRSKFNFRKRLYMVAGVRIARGARKTEYESSSLGGNLSAGVDMGLIGGPPVTVGVDGSVHGSGARTKSFMGASDFVYAYRLFEIYYGKEVSFRPYNGGETYNVHCGVDDEDVEMDEGEELEEEVGISVEGISSTDYDGDGKLRLAESPQSESAEECYLIRQ